MRKTVSEDGRQLFCSIDHRVKMMANIRLRTARVCIYVYPISEILYRTLRALIYDRSSSHVFAHNLDIDMFITGNTMHIHART